MLFWFTNSTLSGPLVDSWCCYLSPFTDRILHWMSGPYHLLCEKPYYFLLMGRQNLTRLPLLVNSDLLNSVPNPYGQCGVKPTLPTLLVDTHVHNFAAFVQWMQLLSYLTFVKSSPTCFALRHHKGVMAIRFPIVPNDVLEAMEQKKHSHLVVWSMKRKLSVAWSFLFSPRRTWPCLDLLGLTA